VAFQWSINGGAAVCRCGAVCGLHWLPTQLLHPSEKRGSFNSMSIRLATAVNTNRNNLRTNNRARPMRDCALGR